MTPDRTVALTPYWLSESERDADDVHIYGSDGDAIATVHGNLGRGVTAWEIASALAAPSPDTGALPLNDENGPWCGCGQPLGHAVPNVDCDPAPLPDTAALDVAWSRAEAALPEGWSILVGDSRRKGRPGYWATASQPFQEDTRGYTIVSTTDGRPPDLTPAAALDALAAALAAREADHD